MKDHRVWTAVITYCRNIPIDQTLVDRVKALIKEDKNVLIMFKKEDPSLNSKFTPEEKFKALCEVFNDELAMSKIIISTIPDVTEIVEIGDRLNKEELAQYAHDAWSGWIKYMWSKSELNPKSGKIEIPKWAVERWTRQSNTSYKDLSQDEKESDREEAKKMIKIFKKGI